MNIRDWYDNGLRNAWGWARYLAFMLVVAALCGIVTGIALRLGHYCG